MTDKLIKKKEKYITERISKKGTHSLQVCIRLNDQTFRKSIMIDQFPTPGAALAFAVKLRDETLLKMRTGYTVAHQHTVKDMYLKTFDLFPVHTKTRKKHDIFFKHGIAMFADQPITKLKAADIQESINTYAKTHTRRQTAGLLAVWRKIYKACALLNVNVIDRTTAVTIPECIQGKHRKKEISSQDLECFCNALLAYNAGSISGSYNCQAVYYAIRIMQYCGLRPAEAFALCRSDVDLKRNIIIVSKASHSTVTETLAISNTKTEQSIRSVPIPADLIPILKECLQWSKHDTLLAKYNGSLFDIDEIDTLIGNVRKRCNVNFTLYMLRHQFSTDLITAGTPLNIVRDLMGHESGSMSLDYAVSSEEERQKAINARKIS